MHSLRVLSLGAALGLALALGAAGAAQDRRVLPQSGDAYFPLRPGAAWKYRRTQAGGVASDLQLTCRGPVAAGNRRAFELVARTDDGVGFEYWNADASGVWEHPNANMGSGAMAAASGMTAGMPARWLPTPVGVETTWEWQAPVRPRGGTGRWPTAQYRGAIDTFAESIEVPAGAFEAVKVSTWFRWPDSDDGQRTVLWLVPGTGPVRREVYDIEAGQETLRYRDDLTAFTPGPDTGPDLLATATTFVAAHGDLWPEPPVLQVLELPLQESAIVTRFVLATGASGRKLLAVDGETTTIVDLGDIASLRALWASDAIPPAPAAGTGSANLTRFAKLCCMLRRSLASGKAEPVRFGMSRTSSSGGPDGFVHTGTFFDGDDQIAVTVKDGTLQQVKFGSK